MLHATPPPATRSPRSDALGRYYTIDAVAATLIKSVASFEPRTFLDLGSGDGSLSAAAWKAWPLSNGVTVDIDETADAAFCRRMYPVIRGGEHIHKRLDLLRTLTDEPHVPAGGFDLVLSNPPFLPLPKRTEFLASILAAAGIPASAVHERHLSADVVFVAQALRCVREGGRVALILPAGFMVNQRTAGMREHLLTQHSVERIIRLPRNSFHGTDASAYILVVRKGRSNPTPITFQEMSPDFVPGRECSLTPSAPYFRFECADQGTTQSPRLTPLRELTVSLTRGSYTTGQRKALPFPLFHTTNFPVDGQSRAACCSHSLDAVSRRAVIAKPGDILVGRLGRNLHSKVCLVTEGHAVLTDWVLRLRVHPGSEQRVLEGLRSERGAAWLEGVSQGVSIKHLSKADLLDFGLVSD